MPTLMSLVATHVIVLLRGAIGCPGLGGNNDPTIIGKKSVYPNNESWNTTPETKDVPYGD